MKKIILLLSLIGIMTQPAVAAIRVASKEAATAALRKENSLQEIERRLASLNNLLTKINSLTKLTAGQKTTLIQQVQEQITALTALKGAIETETDPIKLTVEKKSIIDSYRIFALFMPKINILAQADKVLNLVELMTSKTTDTAALALINEVKTVAQDIINKISILTPQGYPANKTVLQEARKSLATSIAKLKEARKFIK